MTALILLHAVVAISAAVVYRRAGVRVFWYCALAPFAALVWATVHAPSILDGRTYTESASWVPALGLDLSFRVDAFSVLMIGLVSGIGVLVFLYAAPYFAGHERPKIGAFSAQLTLFAGAMLGLVTADNVYLLFIFWELTAITSYLLIGFEDEKGSARAAARQAVLITSAGGLALLAGMVLLAQSAGTTSLHAILADPPSGGVVTAALLLVLLGAFTKSAQVPFHSWLPAAMAAPTPVSAYLHSATMVKAGIYLIARFAPPFAGEPGWRPLVIVVGLTTMFVGGYRALRQHDLKLLLAYGTVSQLGLLVVLFGCGTPATTEAGVALLLAHALFKAALFLVVGIIDHQAHTRDVRLLHGLGRRFPALATFGIIAGASMAGIPLCFGFIAKELTYDAFLHPAIEPTVDTIVLAAIVAASTLTVAYTGRFVWGAFARKAPSPGAELVGPNVVVPSRAFVAPVAVLAFLTLAFGVAPRLVSTLVIDSALALDPSGHFQRLKLWHGVNAALLLSALTLAVGAVLIAQRRRVERWQAAAPSPPGSDAGYQGSLRLLNRTADVITGVTQTGSLPTYVTVIAATVLVVPGIALARAAFWPTGAVWADSWLQVVVAGLLIAAGIATTLARRRFVAVLLMGAVGYSVAALFVIQGGPDLALTQLLVETLTVVVFVLVMRHLPERFSSTRARSANAGHVVIAIGVGVFVTAFTLVAAAARTSPSISEGLIEESVPKGGGRNVVNVILTDFRAFDTLGEITVLAVAALGIASLVAAGRRDSHEDSRGDAQ